MVGNDLSIYETGNGGDLAVLSNDLALGDVLLQTAYVSMFGGNVEADTLGNEPTDEIRLDWWGNSLLFPNGSPQQFNSQTERALKNNPLTSNGRVAIQLAAQNDLANLSNFATVSVTVNILSTNSVQIVVQLTQNDSMQSQTLAVLWDNLKQTAIIQEVI